MFRGVAQFGRVPEWGSGGRWFESSHSDQKAQTAHYRAVYFFLTRFLHDFVQNFNRPFFLARVQMRICVPCHLYICVSQAAGDFLNIYSFVCEKRYMAVSEIMYSYLFYSGSFCISFVMVFYRAVAERFCSSANSIIICETFCLLPPFFMLVQNIHERLWQLERSD